MIQQELRKNQRFDLRLQIELVRTGNEPLGRVTETRNVSSGGVLFASESQLPLGQPLEYFITLLSGKEAREVRIHCIGTVIRLESRSGRLTKEREKPFDVAATLERYEFVRNGR